MFPGVDQLPGMGDLLRRQLPLAPEFHAPALRGLHPGADDVVYTMQVLLDPALHSATGDAFQGGSGAVRAAPRGKDAVAVAFPEPVANAARLFDQAAIMSRNSPLKER